MLLAIIFGVIGWVLAGPFGLIVGILLAIAAQVGRPRRNWNWLTGYFGPQDAPSNSKMDTIYTSTDGALSVGDVNPVDGAIVIGVKNQRIRYLSNGRVIIDADQLDKAIAHGWRRVAVDETGSEPRFIVERP